MSEHVQPYTYRPACQKCGAHDPHDWEYGSWNLSQAVPRHLPDLAVIGAPVVEALRITCGRCGNRWFMQPIDSTGDPQHA